MIQQAEEEPRAPQPADPAAVLAACKAAGCLDVAEDLIATKATLEQVTARVQQEQATRQAEAERASEIRTLCAMAKHPERAEQYIRANVSVQFVREDLTYWTAKLDKVEIDASLLPDAGGAAVKTRLNSSAIYAERAARPGQRGA
jgi:hypothetical protein